jgi:hypothetical protein
MNESATIEVWAEDRDGPAETPHILELTVVGRGADGSWLTPADAIGGEVALSGAVRSCTDGDGGATVDATHLRRVLAEAYPGARMSFHLACGRSEASDEGMPRLIHQELARGRGGRCG